MQSHLLRTKDAPIILEIPSDFRALCQELGQTPNVYFLFPKSTPQKFFLQLVSNLLVPIPVATAKGPHIV